MFIEAFGSVDLTIGVGFKCEDVVSFVDSHRLPNLEVSYVAHEPGIEDWNVYRSMELYVNGPFIGLPGDVIPHPDACRSVLEAFKRHGAPDVWLWMSYRILQDIDLLEFNQLVRGYLSNDAECVKRVEELKAGLRTMTVTDVVERRGYKTA